MTGVNHYLVGVASAVVLENPILVLPVAFASHFVLDALPHFGMKFADGRDKVIMQVTAVDTVLLIGVIVLTLEQYPKWYSLAGLVAMSPDIAWVYRFTFPEKFGKLPPGPENRFNHWHSSIQKYESKPGILIEICVALGLFLLLFTG